MIQSRRGAPFAAPAAFCVPSWAGALVVAGEARGAICERRVLTCKRGAPTKHARDPPRTLRRTGFNIAMVLSPELAAIVGCDMMTRMEVVSALAAYVKREELFLPGDRRWFKCDTKLAALFGFEGKERLLAFNKLISPHISHPNSHGPEVAERSRQMFQQYLERNGAESASRAPDPRGKNSAHAQKALRVQKKGMYAELPVPARLVPICGSESLSRPQLMRAVWKYIKDNKLQDPSDGKLIRADKKLQLALGLEENQVINSFHMGRYLWRKK